MRAYAFTRKNSGGFILFAQASHLPSQKDIPGRREVCARGGMHVGVGTCLQYGSG